MCRTLKKCFVVCLSWKRRKRDYFWQTGMWCFQDKGSAPVVITFGWFLLRTQILWSQPQSFHEVVQRGYSLLISWWHAANCINPFVRGKGRCRLLSSIILARRSRGCLGASCSKEEPTDNEDSCCPGSNHWSPVPRLTPHPSEAELSRLHRARRSSWDGVCVHVCVCLLSLRIPTLTNICCNIAVPSKAERAPCLVYLP